MGILSREEKSVEQICQIRHEMFCIFPAKGFVPFSRQVKFVIFLYLILFLISILPIIIHIFISYILIASYEYIMYCMFIFFYFYVFEFSASTHFLQERCPRCSPPTYCRFAPRIWKIKKINIKSNAKINTKMN